MNSVKKIGTDVYCNFSDILFFLFKENIPRQQVCVFNKDKK